MSTVDCVEKLVSIPDGEISLEGSLGIPDGATGIVIFAHGSGSSRLSPRNNYVAEVLRQHDIGTLLLDLLTYEEDANYEMRFNIDFLAGRLITATKWLQEYEKMTRPAMKIGYFGASTGAAAAIQAASILENQIDAIVSRGGRPDLAWEYLDNIKAPTLLIAGGYDDVVINLNQKAYERIRAVKQLEIIPRATHLFEEPGALESVSRLAAEWFKKYL